MAATRKVLIADPDLAAVRPLTKALRARAYQVQYAPDGSKALEVAVLRHPDVILFDVACSQIEARSFVQILNTNPRTDDIPVVMTLPSDDAARQHTFRDGVIGKPYNLDEVLSRIDHLCRRAEAARELRGDAREIEGALAQLPLADLMQILSMNRRTGKLLLTQGAERGEIHLSQGRPVNARINDVEGEKALFRLIAWRDGSFAFAPGPAPVRARIDRSMEDALLEGMRQADERARLLEGLPPLAQAVMVAPEATAPVEPHPVTAEVLGLLNQPRRISDVLDAAQAPDLEVLAAVSALLQRGLVHPHDSAPAKEGPLLGPAEVHSLRGRMMRGGPARTLLTSKLLVCGSGVKAARWLLKALPGLVPSSNDPACLRSNFGTLGTVEISDVLHLDFVLVPFAEAARPLWRPFSVGAVGALVLEDSEPALRLARFCAFELRLPIVVAAKNASNHGVSGEVLPTALRGAPGGAAIVTSDISTAVRSVLLSALATPTDMPDAVMRSRPGLS